MCCHPPSIAPCIYALHPNLRNTTQLQEKKLRGACGFNLHGGYWPCATGFHFGRSHGFHALPAVVDVRMGDCRYCRCQPCSASARFFYLLFPRGLWMDRNPLLYAPKSIFSISLPGSICCRSYSVPDRLWTMWCAGSSI